MERQIDSPRCSFAFAFVMIMLGMQATTAGLAYEIHKIPEISFAFVIQQRENPKILGLFLVSRVGPLLWLIYCAYFPMRGTQRNVIVSVSSQRLKGKSGAVPASKALIGLNRA